MNGYEYVKVLKRDMIKKKYEWVDRVNIYVDDSVVYKVAIQYNYGTLKKAKKYGVMGEWEIIRVKQKLEIDNVEAKFGKKILMYDVHSGVIEYWNGESDF